MIRKRLLVLIVALLAVSCQKVPVAIQALPEPATLACLQEAAAIESFVAGKAIYNATCAHCHRFDGTGNPGKVPPLAGNSGLSADPDRGIRMIVVTQSGAAREHGMEVNDLVASLGDLESSDIAAVMTFTLNAWGNCAGPVSEQRVKQARNGGAKD